MALPAGLNVVLRSPASFGSRSSVVSRIALGVVRSQVVICEVRKENGTGQRLAFSCGPDARPMDMAYRVTIGSRTCEAASIAAVGEGMPAGALPQEGVGPGGESHEWWSGIRDRRVRAITALEGYVTSYVGLNPLAIRLP